MKHYLSLSAIGLVLMVSVVASAKYSGGNGHSQPWQIADLDDWQELTSTPADWGSHFVLTADLDLDGIVYSAAPIAPDTDNTDPGHQGPKFTGSIDGQGHTIYNLTIDAPAQDYVGLIGHTDGPANVKNLTLSNTAIVGRNQTGGLIGHAGGWGLRVENCVVSGTVQGGNEVGGLAGFHFSGGPILDCSAQVTVQGNEAVGGLIGVNHGGTLSDSSASGDVSGNTAIGGLVGRNPYPHISNSFAEGNVSGTLEVGGLAGANMGQLSQCYAIGNAQGDTRIGGLVGTNLGTVTSCYAGGAVSSSGIAAGGLVGYNAGTISNAYATGAVSANERVGGLAGSNAGAISFAYSIGAIMAGGPYVGGLVGDAEGGGTASHSFWNTETSGLPGSAGGTGLDTEQMQDMQTYLDAGWDFVDETVNGTDDLWVMSACTDYPALSWEPVCDESVFAGGSGTALEPFLVETANHLNNVRDYPDACFLQIAPIHLGTAPWHQGQGWLPIGDNTTRFTGSYDGGGFAISNLIVNRPDQNYAGLFGRAQTAVLKNIILTSVIINGDEYVGALAGMAVESDISNCSSNGVIFADDIGGGLIGQLTQSTMTDCHSSCAVSGDEWIGGLVGRAGQSSVMTDCYAIGTVQGDSFRTGGLVGSLRENSHIINCYANATVSGDELVGTLAGDCQSGSSIIHSYALGSATGHKFVGGLVGELSNGHITLSMAKANAAGNEGIGGLVGRTISYSEGQSASIYNSYAQGNAVGGIVVGGLIGNIFIVDNGAVTIADAYAVGAVSGSDLTGGFAGEQRLLSPNLSLTNCFWDVQTSGQPISHGGTPKSTAAMKQADTFIDAGWDFAAIWGIGQDQTYPYLLKRPAADLNYDGVVNLADLAIFAGQWLEGM